jgi:hypothetical protein
MDKYLFEYAIIRFVPKVEREEFINVGVILFCKDLNFLELKYQLNITKLVAIGPQVEAKEVEQNLQAFKKICEGDSSSGPIGTLSPAERFRWLTATRSTMIQSSKVHPGLCENAALLLDKLFLDLVI